jgi:DNA-3-methyladenine glycosylase I
VAAAIDLRAGDDGRTRCGWVGTDVEYRRYHDEEWGFPLHGDQRVFEKLSLEAFQAGLSWITILKRRENFRQAFHEFNPLIVAGFGDREVDTLMGNIGIIRNRAKILATIENASITQSLIDDDEGALDRLLWSHQPRVPSPRPRSLADLPAHTPESNALSRTLRTLGFRFVGPITCYALMQSSGLVDDHLVGCWRATPAHG